MLKGRHSHSCCVHGGTRLYVVGGQNKQGPISEIETIDLAIDSHWTAFNSDVFTARDYAVVCTLSSKTFAVLGGENKGSLSDAMLIKRKRHTVKKIKTLTGSFAF